MRQVHGAGDVAAPERRLPSPTACSSTKSTAAGLQGGRHVGAVGLQFQATPEMIARDRGRAGGNGGHGAHRRSPVARTDGRPSSGRAAWRRAGLPVSVAIMPKPQARLSPADRLVVVLAYDGLCTFEFGVAVEIFGLPRPEMGPDWYRFAVAGLDPGPMRAEGGVRLLADGGLDLLEQAGTIVVPGWRGAEMPVPEPLATALRAAAARGARILSICSGVFVLAAAGSAGGAPRHHPLAPCRGPGRAPSRHPLHPGRALRGRGRDPDLRRLGRRDRPLPAPRAPRFRAAAANRVARRLVVPPHRDGGQAQVVAGCGAGAPRGRADRAAARCDAGGAGPRLADRPPSRPGPG